MGRLTAPAFQLGQLSQLLTILTATRVTTAGGGFTNTYATAGTLRGVVYQSIRQIPESVIAGQPTDVQLVEFTLYDYAGLVTGKTRLQDEAGNQYEVLKIGRTGDVVLGWARLV